MKNNKWYKPLLEKVYDSYSDHIVVDDKGGFSVNPELREELSKDFLLHDFESELMLRAFINEKRGERVIVFKKPNISYLPYDIEERSDIVIWQENDVDLEYQYEKKARSFEGEFLEELLSDSALELKLIEQLLHSEKPDWGKVSHKWGYISFLLDKYRINKSYVDDDQIGQTIERVEKIEGKLKVKLTDFVLNHYNNLFYESFINSPVTVDRVLAYLGQQQPGKKVLICFDGMGFQEWFTIKEYLEHKSVDNFREGHVFALLPTVTSISRRALFSGEKRYGKLPNEKKGFTEYVSRKWPSGKTSDIAFFHNARTDYKPEYTSGDYVGIIFNLVDDLIHQFKNMDISKKLFQNNLSIILGDTELDQIIVKYLEQDYRVFISSDHGSVWCQGMGLKQDKHLLEERAKRACLFNNELLAKEFVEKDRELKLFKCEEIFDDQYLVFSPWRKMFGNVDQNEITHGGMHLEEVVVPFVEVLK